MPPSGDIGYGAAVHGQGRAVHVHGLTKGLAAAIVAGTVLLPTVADAGSPAPPRPVIEVVKVVEGDVSVDTEFVVSIECDTPEPLSAEFTFGPGGGTQSADFSDDNQCLVTETDDGGAESVTYEATCSGECVADPPTEDGVVLHLQQNGAVATVTVTNTFPEAVPVEPAPATVVDAAPAFTG
jgi:hypothetical protein